jgi:NADPH:quinone reductase-like Zn-dependent oxidoreductase
MPADLPGDRDVDGRKAEMATMKAVRIHRYGGPQVLTYEDAPRPEPAAGEVLVRVRAAGVNPVDWRVRAGYAREYLKHSLPLIPGWDVAGVVEATGPGVSRWTPGDEVYGGLDLARDGSYAEFMCVRETALARKPRSLEFSRAAGIPMEALTAWQSLFDSAGLTRGQTVLIHAAAGGVGHFGVQLARWKGAHVIGTASARNASLVRALGADHVIDYMARRFEDAVCSVDARGVPGHSTRRCTAQRDCPAGGRGQAASGRPDRATARRGAARTRDESDRSGPRKDCSASCLRRFRAADPVP